MGRRSHIRAENRLPCTHLHPIVQQRQLADGAVRRYDRLPAAVGGHTGGWVCRGLVDIARGQQGHLAGALAPGAIAGLQRLIDSVGKAG